jgi:glycosyltransferase involved in cell wall biosynthesis
MKILLISSYLPYPLYSGGQVRLYNLIKELSHKHEITLICEKRTNQTKNDVAEVQKICKEVITVERKKQWSISNVLKSGISTHSFLVTGHTQAAFKQKIQEALEKNKFDLIHVETYYVMQNLGDMNKKSDGIIPVVLVEHNIEYLVYKKFMQRAPSIIGPLLGFDIAKIKREEELFWKVAQEVVAVSQEDQMVMKQAGINSSIVPNGVNTKQFSYVGYEDRSKEKDRKILYLGDFKWLQNRDAASFILKEIWPEIALKSGTSGIKLWIVGRKIPSSIRNLTNDPNVLFDEDASSLPTEKIFQQSSLLLAPIRIGGGTSYKILESMSTGTPVVTMQMSADALGAQGGQSIMIGKTPKELAEKCLELLSDKDIYKKISKNERELIEKNYTWGQIGKKLDEVYSKTVL